MEGEQPIVVVHPGSLNLRVGTSAGQSPFTIRHCIARRRRLPAASSPPPAVREMALAAAERDLSALARDCGLADDSWRLPAPEVAAVNATGAAYESGKPTVVSPVTQHLNKADADVYVGEAALCQPAEKYQLSWPLRRGRFDPARPATAVLRDLADIWTVAIERHLGIARAHFPGARCVLLVPDAFNRREVCGLANLVLREMRFGALVCHLENVCATFGIGLPSACVVNVGDQKVSISCVEDGISLPESRLTLPYGGDDVTRALAQWLASAAALPDELCRQACAGNQRACHVLRRVKEAVCSLEKPEAAGGERLRSFAVVAELPDLHVKASFSLGGEAFLSPMMFFCPSAFNKAVSCSLEDEPPPTCPCWDDPLEDLMLISRQTAGAGKKKGGASRRPKSSEADSAAGRLPALDEAVFTSISRVESEETRLKLLCCVVLVGAGLSFPGANRVLEALLLKRQWERHLTAAQRASLDSPRPDVIAQFKDLAAGDAAWMGGAIMTKVDFVQELWITPEEWTRHGARILREMSPFQW